MGAGFSVGQWIEVRPREEILRTLDANGCLEGMPFMPEMVAYCGRRMQVWKSAHKTCDTVYPVRSRRLDNTVHLQTRCDGSAHGGCQAGCLIFWKEAWLKPVGSPESSESPVSIVPRATEPAAPGAGDGGCRLADVIDATRVAGVDDDDPTFVCQATRLPYATKDLSPYDPRQYIQDLKSGNVRLAAWLSGITYICFQRLVDLGVGWGPMLAWLYDRFQSAIGGISYPRRAGDISLGQPTPTAALDLQPGEWVRVRSQRDILATCNANNRNRGLSFDAEHVPFCGQVHRVLMRVDRIINEKTGKMMQMKNPCIVLEGGYCGGRYSECRLFCARAIHLYWREIWLDRLPTPQPEQTGAPSDPSSGRQRR